MWAKDGFKGKDGVWGGDLVDTSTPFAGRDKVQHLILALLFVRLQMHVFGAHWFWALTNLLIVSILWELVEYARKSMGIEGLAVDDISWRDVVAGLVGGVLGVLLF